MSLFQRISLLEQRHNELENVLERLTTAVECGIVHRKPSKQLEVAVDDVEGTVDDVEEAEEATEDVGGATAAVEPEKDVMNFSRGLVLDLFVEFQHKIRNFAEDLNGTSIYWSTDNVHALMFNQLLILAVAF